MNREESASDYSDITDRRQILNPEINAANVPLTGVAEIVSTDIGVASAPPIDVGGSSLITASTIHPQTTALGALSGEVPRAWWDIDTFGRQSATMTVGQANATQLQTAGGATCGLFDSRLRCDAAGVSGRYVDAGFTTAVPDHSLASDLTPSFSPGAMPLMYEQECTPEMTAFSFCEPAADNFDLEPQFERSDDLSKLGSAGFGAMKVEDAFVDQKDITHGPTLAALNSDQSRSWIDDIDVFCSLERNATCGRQTVTTAVKPPSACAMASRQLPQFSGCLSSVTATCAFVPGGSHCSTFNPTNTATCSLTDLLPVKQEPGSVPGSVSGLVPGSVPGLVVKPEPPIACPDFAACFTSAAKRGVKRSLSPQQDSNNSMDKKWEEIKQFIDDNMIRQEQQQQQQQQQQRTGPMPLFSSPLSTTLMSAQVLPSAPPQTSTLVLPSTLTEWISSSPSAKKRSFSDERGDVAFTMKEDVDSQDEGFDSDDDGDNDNDSDADSDVSHASATDDFSPTSCRKGSSSSGSSQLFWQYNMQSKGPKGKRLCQGVPTNDPHVLSSFEDPVFDPNINQTRYKHSGKARRGDGNDITPNPRKLHQLGGELARLSRRIHDLSPNSHQPATVRSRSRKEKNKYASRACRLKKKAQHEANKVKLHGLEKEHNELMLVIEKIKKRMCTWVENHEKGAPNDVNMSEMLQQLIDSNLSNMVAGYTTDFVNLVVEKVTAGDQTGGLRLDKN